MTRRVVMVIAQYPPIIGGTERACQRLSAALVRLGHSVTVLTRQAPGTLAREIENGVEVRRIAVSGGRIAAALGFIGGALRELRGIPHDVVHCHQALSPATVGALARRMGGKPVVVKLAGPGAAGDLATVRRGVMTPVRRWVLSVVGGWICPSKELVGEITEFLPGARTWHVPNGVDAHALAPLGAEERDALRRQLGLTAKTILFTGALRPEKNLPLLVRALSGVPDDVHLALVGEGTMRPAIEAAIQERGLASRVRLVGAVSDPRPWLLACDAFTLPSASEGMSNSLLEAMAAALPIVASDVPGNAGLVTHGEHGLLCEANSEAALARALADIMLAPERARALGAAARARILADYALDAVADRVARIYAEL